MASKLFELLWSTSWIYYFFKRKTLQRTHPSSSSTDRRTESTFQYSIYTLDCTIEPIQHSGIKHSVGKVIPHSNLSRHETPYKLGRSTPWYFKLQNMSCGGNSSMSNSSRSKWKLAEQSMITVLINFVQHTQPSNITSITQRQETLIRLKPSHRIHLALKKLKVTFSSWRPHQRTILKDFDNVILIVLSIIHAIEIRHY